MRREEHEGDCKQTHTEAKDVPRSQIFALRHSADFGSMLLAVLCGQEHLTTLEITVCPHSFETHI